MKELKGLRQSDQGRLAGLRVKANQQVKATRKKSATKLTDENQEESLEEGLAERQSLLCFERDPEFYDGLHYEEFQSDLEDIEHEERMRAELFRVLGELQVHDMALVDLCSMSLTKTKGFTRYLSLPFVLIEQAKHKASHRKLTELAELYAEYLSQVKKEATKLITEELIEYSLTESAFREIRSSRHKPSLRSITLEKIRTYSLKHKISQRYAGVCFNLKVRELEHKESAYDRDEIERLDPEEIKEALLFGLNKDTRENLLDTIGAQYICDQVISREGGYKFQAKLAIAYRLGVIIVRNNLNLKRPTCYNTLQIRGTKNGLK